MTKQKNVFFYLSHIIYDYIYILVGNFLTESPTYYYVDTRLRGGEIYLINTISRHSFFLIEGHDDTIYMFDFSFRLGGELDVVFSSFLRAPGVARNAIIIVYSIIRWISVRVVVGCSRLCSTSIGPFGTCESTTYYV